MVSKVKRGVQRGMKMVKRKMKRKGHRGCHEKAPAQNQREKIL